MACGRRGLHVGLRPCSRAGLLFLVGGLLIPSGTCRSAEVNAGHLPAAAAEAAATREIEVAFASGACELNGTLFLPAGIGPARAFALLAGADRGARNPWRLRLAKQLAGLGTAVLVYDSPGTGASRGESARFQTRDDRVEEARAAVAFLRGRPELDAARVGLMGGSEGADIALLAAVRDPAVAFVIAMSAALDAPVFELLAYSAEKRGHVFALSDGEIARAATFKELSYVILAGLELAEWSLLEERVRRWDEPGWAEFIDLARTRCGELSPAAQEVWLLSLRELLAGFARQPWFASVAGAAEFAALAKLDAPACFAFLERAPFARDWQREAAGEIAAIRCPVLAVWGEEDEFLPPRRSAARLKRILGEGEHPGVTIKVLPGADHSLLRVGSPEEYAPEFVPLLTSWLEDR